MMDEEIVVGIVALNGGRLVGKTRLQKTAYLLQRCGMNADIKFEYHNFGPFSVDIARACNDAAAEGVLDMTPTPGFHQVPYVVFETEKEPEEYLGDLPAERARELLEIMKPYSAIELEIGATIAFIDEESGAPIEVVRSAVEELKPAKATEERLKRAQELLEKLGIM